jgi:hypothetical protein
MPLGEPFVPVESYSYSLTHGFASDTIKPESPGRFHKLMTQESAHTFDMAHSIAFSRAHYGKKAVKQDIAEATIKLYLYPSEYEKVSLKKDFAASVAIFIKTLRISARPSNIG